MEINGEKMIIDELREMIFNWSNSIFLNSPFESILSFISILEA